MWTKEKRQVQFSKVHGLELDNLKKGEMMHLSMVNEVNKGSP